MKRTEYAFVRCCCCSYRAKAVALFPKGLSPVSLLSFPLSGLRSLFNRNAYIDDNSGGGPSFPLPHSLSFF